MELNEILAYGRSRAGNLADVEARRLRESLEETTLKLLGLPDDERETPEAEELDRSTSRLAREIAVLRPDCLEALRAKITSALYWIGDGSPEPWRDLASPYLDTLTTHDILISFGEVFAADYKRRLDDIYAKRNVDLRKVHLEICDSESASVIEVRASPDNASACAI